MIPTSTRATRTPACWEYSRRPMITRIIDSYQIPGFKRNHHIYRNQEQDRTWYHLVKTFGKNSDFEKKMWHTFRSSLIWYVNVNMKWIRLVLWKIQSGHDLVYRRTDVQTDVRTDGQSEISGDGGGMMNMIYHCSVTWNEVSPSREVWLKISQSAWDLTGVSSALLSSRLSISPFHKSQEALQHLDHVKIFWWRSSTHKLHCQ